MKVPHDLVATYDANTPLNGFQWDKLLCPSHTGCSDTDADQCQADLSSQKRTGGVWACRSATSRAVGREKAVLHAQTRFR
jgi:hypothetical protein